MPTTDWTTIFDVRSFVASPGRTPITTAPNRFRLLQLLRYHLEQPHFPPMVVTIPSREGALAAAQREVPFALNKVQQSLVKLLDTGRELEWVSRNETERSAVPSSWKGPID
ncbi:hypothetical protein Aspvir_007955 [Aspergillus viridinutans]|uniref:Uncharacterized protein n=1 Tax=Aspergillus viridinutans TaxID=75553 RepID=A0A9P3F6X6_ASPVI|nr:uncharacterized protein Aspvir_007955 [Aspergillus viridinutans]GIK03880.1 hypothetical protein Aspvir_007955 [Aspergillus viridinutans]